MGSSTPASAWATRASLTCCGVLAGLRCEVQRGHARDVRRGHRRATDEVGRGGAADPVRRDLPAGHGAGAAGREVVAAGGEDVDAGPAVGVVGACVGLGGRAHGDSRGGAGRGVVARVAHGARRAVVAGCHRVRDPRVDGVGDRRVQRGAAAPEAHVGDGRLDRVGGDPVDARDHLAVGAAATAVEHPHRDELHLLRHAVGGAADRARDVGAVAVAVDAVLAVADLVDADARPAAEVGVRGQDAGVDDVGVHARAVGRVAVRVVERQGRLVEAVETPRRRRRLRGVDVHVAVLLHAGDRRVVGDLARLRRAHPRGVAVQRVAVDPLHLAAVAVRDADGLGHHCVGVGGAQRDDVLARHRLGRGDDGVRAGGDRIDGLRGGDSGRADQQTEGQQGGEQAERKAGPGSTSSPCHRLPTISDQFRTTQFRRSERTRRVPPPGRHRAAERPRLVTTRGHSTRVIASYGGRHEQEDPEAEAALAAQEGQPRQAPQRGSLIPARFPPDSVGP